MTSRLAWLLLAATILVQICFPLTSGGTPALTTASVLLFAAAMLVDAASTHGVAAALVLLVVAGGGGLWPRPSACTPAFRSDVTTTPAPSGSRSRVFRSSYPSRGS